MAEERLHVFISYSSEDRDLATAIAEELRRAFNPTILKLTIDVEFSLGSNWRDRLKADLDDTDILLVVATGKQKVSHSFTGFEVGYFDASISTFTEDGAFSDPGPDHDPDRRFHQDAGDHVRYSGAAINAPFDPMVVDPAALKNPASPAGADQRRHEENSDLQAVQAHPGDHQPVDPALRRRAGGCQSAIARIHWRLFNIVHLELQKRVYQENFPERKIVVPHKPCGGPIPAAATPCRMRPSNSSAGSIRSDFRRRKGGRFPGRNLPKVSGRKTLPAAGLPPFKC